MEGNTLIVYPYACDGEMVDVNDDASLNQDSQLKTRKRIYPKRPRFIEERV